MIDFLSNILGTVFGFLGSALPDSPFQEMFELTAQMRLGLGWLNWFFPVGSALALFATWLALCVAVVAARIIFVNGRNAIGGMLNNNGGYTT